MRASHTLASLLDLSGLHDLHPLFPSHGDSNASKSVKRIGLHVSVPFSVLALGGPMRPFTHRWSRR